MFRSRRMVLCWFLVAATTMPPLVACAQAPAAPEVSETGKLDISYVVPDACFGAVVFPKRILASPLLQMNPMIAPLVEGMKTSWGFDPDNVERLVGVAEYTDDKSGFGVGVVLHFAEPPDSKAILPRIRQEATESAIDDKPLFVAAKPEDPSLYLADDRTVLVGNERVLRKMVENRHGAVEGRMSSILGGFDESNDVLAIVLIEPLRQVIKAKIANEPPPPEYADVAKIPDLVHSVGVKMSLGESGRFILSARCPDEPAAMELDRIIQDLIAKAEETINAKMADVPADDPAAQAMAQQMRQGYQMMVEIFRPVRKGKRLEVIQEGAQSAAAVGMSVALVLPAIQAVREAARRTQEK